MRRPSPIPSLLVALALAGCGGGGDATDGSPAAGGDVSLVRDAATPDAVGIDIGGTSPPDLTFPPDLATGMPANGTGTPCAKNGDCPSGICLPLGAGRNACTTSCGTDGDCVSGWSCKALLGQPSNVCQCAPSSETCNGKDDDCNGVVDDEPATDQLCVQSSGANHVCAMGACGCRATCSGACVDTMTDAMNCGGCGTVCPQGAACVGGQCACQSPLSLCSGLCVDETRDVKNCGGCGKACGTPANATAACMASQCVLHCNTGFADCDNSAGNGCETDLQSSATSCGSCGRSCQGGACSMGNCQAVTVASGADARALATDATSVYYAGSTTSLFGGGTLSIYKVAKGGGAPMVLVANQAPSAMAVDATSLYYALRDGTVWKIGINAFGAPPTKLASTPNVTSASPTSVAVDASRVYWSDNALGVFATSLAGGAVATLSTNGSGGITIDAQYVYSLAHAQNGVERIPVGGGTATLLNPANPIYNSGGIAHDAQSVYVSDFQGHVWSLPIAGGATTMVAQLKGAVTNVVYDGTSLYLNDGGNWSIARVAPTGGPVTIIESSQFRGIFGLAVDASFVYWTTSVSQPPGPIVLAVTK